MESTTIDNNSSNTEESKDNKNISPNYDSYWFEEEDEIDTSDYWNYLSEIQR